MRDAIYRSRSGEKEDTKMKNKLSRKAAYIGAGAGLVLFAIFGLLPGSLIGGALGIKFAGLLFGLPLEGGLVAKAIVLTSMLLGVLVSGVVIVTASSTSAWLVGRVLEATAHEKASQTGIM
jgi:small-conductance mechanosensitive channel